MRSNSRKNCSFLWSLMKWLFIFIWVCFFIVLNEHALCKKKILRAHDIQCILKAVKKLIMKNHSYRKGCLKVRTAFNKVVSKKRYHCRKLHGKETKVYCNNQDLRKVSHDKKF